MVSPTGLEPVTHALKVHCYYHLSYKDKLVVLTGLQPVTWNLEDSYSDATELQNQIIFVGKDGFEPTTPRSSI